MAYTMDVGIGLGHLYVGIQATMRIQLIDSDGTNIGAAIAHNPPTSIITEIGDGYYLWHYISFPDNFRGAFSVYDNSDPTTVLALSSVNPEDIEKVQNKDIIDVNVGRSDSNFTVVQGVYENLETPKYVVKPGVK